MADPVDTMEIDRPSSGGRELGGLMSGRVAMIVGVGPGLGRDLALAFADAGADVALGARRPEVLASVAEEVAGLGRRAIDVGLDVTDDDSIERFVARTADDLGRLDAVVYNAFAPSTMTTVLDGDLDEWTRSFDVNVIGAARVAREAANHLAEHSGSIVMINSQAARRSQARRGTYSASKSALLSLARTLASELGRDGVRVNSVVPGHIWGPPLEHFFEERARRLGTTPQAVYADVARDMALRRIATGAEVANAAVFLASPAASGITGQSLDVNAGNWFE